MLPCVLRKCGTANLQPANVLVKFSRPEQDLRFDVPGTGLATVATCAEAGVSVVALEAGRVLMYERDEMIALANRSNIAIVGVTADDSEGAT